MKQLEKEIILRIKQYENPRRVSLSKKFARLKKPIIFLRHQSVLRRRLGRLLVSRPEKKVMLMACYYRTVKSLMVCAKFGSGATILHNFVDINVKNISNLEFQLKIWLTDNHLKGQIINLKKLTTNFAPVLYKVTQRYLQKNNFKNLDFSHK